MNRCGFLLSVIATTSCSIAAQQAAQAPDVTSPASSARGQWTVRGHIPLEDFVIYSHRGAGELVPENTIAAFQKGWELGTVPEADMRTTKDGVIVAFHDATFKRTVKGVSAELQKKGVSDLTFAELSKLDVGLWKGEQFRGLRVPKLTEVFDGMRGHPKRKLALDFKHVDLRQLAEEVRSHGVEPQVVLATTDYEVIRQWKKLLPDSQTMLWMGEAENKLKERLETLRATGFADITRLQFHPRANANSAASEPFTISRAFLRSTGDELRGRGIVFEAFPRGITDPKAYWELLDLGVATFATDYPDMAVKAVRDYYARR